MFEHSNRNYSIENEGRNYQQVCGILRDRPAHVWVVLWKDLGTLGCESLEDGSRADDVSWLVQFQRKFEEFLTLSGQLNIKNLWCLVS